MACHEPGWKGEGADPPRGTNIVGAFDTRADDEDAARGLHGVADVLGVGRPK